MDLEQVANKIADVLDDAGIPVTDEPLEDLRTSGMLIDTEIDGTRYEVIVRPTSEG